VWNTSWLVRDGSPLGAVLGALIGYRSRPSLLEVLAFVAYIPPMVWALRRSEAGPRVSVRSSAAPSAA
jgi:high-affinity iron transporter